ncbi:ABC transporter permease [Cytobacillus sp. Hm23]
MGTIAKIALRNIFAHKVRSIVIGVVIFFCTFMLLISNAALNGVRQQVTNSYATIQTGDVIVMWESLYEESSPSDPGRFINPIATLSFDPLKEQENTAAIEKLMTYLRGNQHDIDTVFPTVRRDAKVATSENNDSMIIYSLNDRSEKSLLDSKVIQPLKGEIISDRGISISEEMANKLKVGLNDLLNISVAKVNGEMVNKEYKVTGIYANGASYNNWYGFLQEDEARSLYGMEENEFDFVKIFLNNKLNLNEFANDLDQFISFNSGVLRAESYLEASDFYTLMPSLYKSMFNVFIIFLLIIIAVGLRSIVRMNLHQRIKEFGTLRAIGYSKFQNSMLIILESFFLASIALSFAFVTSTIVIITLSERGIEVGGALKDAVGGSSFYLSFQISDLTIAFVSILVFVLFATFKPAVKMSKQRIVDLLEGRENTFKRKNRVKVI